MTAANVLCFADFGLLAVPASVGTEQNRKSRTRNSRLASV